MQGRQQQLFPQPQRTQRLYALFDRVPCINGKLVYRRLSNRSYPLTTARRVFKDQLLAPVVVLRPVGRVQ